VLLGLSVSQFDPKPGPHSEWSLQSERSSFWLNSLSASAQTSHTMSVSAVPAVSKPLPAVHFDHAVHAVLLVTPIWKCWAGQAVQVASTVLSADAVKYCPAGQVVFLAVQAVAAFVPTLNSVEAHTVHVACTKLFAE
jgi:hypothetical protein